MSCCGLDEKNIGTLSSYCVEPDLEAGRDEALSHGAGEVRLFFPTFLLPTLNLNAGARSSSGDISDRQAFARTQLAFFCEYLLDPVTHRREVPIAGSIAVHVKRNMRKEEGFFSLLCVIEKLVLFRHTRVYP